MKRLLYTAPALLLVSFIPGAGFWGPVVLLVGLIFFHELGHFLVAKWMGLPVEVFSLGFGPRVAGFAWQETDVRLSLLPLGGYVRLAGYNPEDPDAEDPHGFLAQPAWKRMAFYSGGILANVLITVVIFFFLGINNARTTAAHPQPSPLLVVEVNAGMPGAQGGLKPGDQITRFGDLKFPGNSNEEAITYIRARSGQPIPVALDREGTSRTLTITPAEVGGAGKIGVAFEPSSWTFDRRPMRAGDLLLGATFAVKGSALLGWEILGNFGKLVSRQVSLKEVGGPITIVRAGSRAAKAGLLQFMGLVALISMNLAVLNALPIPFLDGGHAALLLIEKIRGKDLSNLVKERILTGGFLFFVGLFALIIFQDLWKLRH
ncbi:M50 family metallopeptidase [Mesoterricola silvestris]|uniref:Zinc metalloprotease n=1 Tax=Mesoterricola silvestris TaxID=2927979 RepID=A0AA48GNE3_9BACT|nr:M50 family metallopeptidase [Mesoterricola silvestris]BDU74607.1 zinc metalloprotease [Mesoterricola silvestris]